MAMPASGRAIGTPACIIAIELDNKLGGLPDEVLGQALSQAREGRLHILAEMQKTIAEPGEPSRHVPQAFHISIMPDAVGVVHVEDQLANRPSTLDRARIEIGIREPLDPRRQRRSLPLQCIN